MRGWALLGLALLSFFLAACGGAAEPEAVEVTQVVVTRVVTEAEIIEGEEVEVTRIVSEEVEVTRVVEVEGVATPELEGTATAATTAIPPARTPGPTATPAVAEQIAEVEWPPRMRLGDSDVVRLSLIPAGDGYRIEVEFPEHETVTGTVALEQLSGYDIVAAARLDGVGFNFSPQGEQRQNWRPDGRLNWRWTVSPQRAGQQRLSITLTVHWLPQPGNPASPRQLIAYSQGLNVRVMTLLGMTTGQALLVGAIGLLLGLVLSAPLARQFRRDGTAAGPVRPNPALVLEPHPEIQLGEQEQALLKALFRRYARLAIEVEFQSGYSGARTFLALPIRPDGRADAYTIAKLGGRQAILQEYENYRTYVEHRLPPITARIQGEPATLQQPLAPGGNHACASAALRYTFIGGPGQKPVSLRQSLLEKADPAWLEKLFATFGPNWWMQRQPYTFRLLQEYDRKLPSHYIVEPAEGKGPTLDGRAAPAEVSLAIGDVVTLRHFEVMERKKGGRQWSLRGATPPGLAPLRLRWLSPHSPDGATARVVATRNQLLQRWAAGYDRCGLPDPLAPLPALLAETVSGSRSTIHGDLNLENVLIGPGAFVWLIDFASTRDGHTLYDFAHLGAEVVAHVVGVQVDSAGDYVALLEDGGGPLLTTLADIAGRCLLNPDEQREYQLALYLSCLGALKYDNVSVRSKHYLYLTAAHLARTLT